MQNVSLTDYVSRMQEGQDKIYYLTADSYLSAKNSPLLEVFRKKGIEVLLLSDRVDEWLMAHLTEFEGKKFQSVSKGKLDMDKTEDKVEEQQQQEKAATFADVVQQIKTALGDRVKDVRLTHRLVDSPACVVFDENELTGHMQRLLKAAGQKIPESKPILELNPDHRLITQVTTHSGFAKNSRLGGYFAESGAVGGRRATAEPRGFCQTSESITGSRRGVT